MEERQHNMSTYKKIGSYTTGGSESSVVFSISSGYKDLKIWISASTNRVSTDDGMMMSINSTTTNVTTRRLYNDGSTASAYTFSGEGFIGNVSSSYSSTSAMGLTTIYITNYNDSGGKVYHWDGGVTRSDSIAEEIDAAYWSTGGAITSLTFTPDSGTVFRANSTFYIYGISNT
jgi:hypothetical protein